MLMRRFLQLGQEAGKAGAPARRACQPHSVRASTDRQCRSGVWAGFAIIRAHITTCTAGGEESCTKTASPAKKCGRATHQNRIFWPWCDCKPIRTGIVHLGHYHPSRVDTRELRRAPARSNRGNAGRLAGATAPSCHYPSSACPFRHTQCLIRQIQQLFWIPHLLASLSDAETGSNPQIVRSRTEVGLGDCRAAPLCPGQAPYSSVSGSNTKNSSPPQRHRWS